MNLTARAAVFKRKVASDAAIMDAWLSLYRRMLETIHPTLVEAGIGISDVRRVAFPNSGRAVVEQRWMGSLNLPLSASVWDFGRGIGHVSASDQVIAFDHLLSSGEIGPGDHLLMVGIGPGITLASAVIKVHHLPAWLQR
jgi:3-oxoacyl-[acyl-carrier-protein] synthase-3/clorobiocin biosynthesis protein CloN2